MTNVKLFIGFIATNVTFLQLLCKYGSYFRVIRKNQGPAFMRKRAGDDLNVIFQAGKAKEGEHQLTEFVTFYAHLFLVSLSFN